MKPLLRALKKCRHHSGREWMVYATPADLLTLAEAGAKFDSSWVDRAKDAIKSGRSGPGWRYFRPNASLEAKLREMKP